MKNTFKKLIALVLLTSMVLGLASCTTTQTEYEGNDPTLVEPEPKKEVTSVAIKYNNKTESDGYINVDLSAGAIDLTATVRVKNKCEYTLTFESSNTDVAEITDDGKVTLKSAGETVITARAGNKSHSVVIIVADVAKSVYAVSVNGGSANLEKAYAGDTVSLTPDPAKTEKFVRWEFVNPDTNETVTDLWVNGNDFRMPAHNLVVTAVYETRTFVLSAVDATIKDFSGNSTDIKIGSTVDGVTTYYVPAGTTVTFNKRETNDGEVFVGWDSVKQGNRKAGALDDEFTIEMPEEDTTVFAVYSSTKTLNFTSAGLAGSSNLKTTAIKDGALDIAVAEGEEAPVADADLNGFSGYRFNFSASSVGLSDEWKENVQGVNRFTTLGDGSQTIKIIYKNHSNYDVVLEFYVSQYKTIATTGAVTVPANSVAEAVLVADYGFHNPAFGLALRNAVGGQSSETVDVDMVWTLANTYPYGDASFDVVDAKYVELYSEPSAADYPANSGIRNNVYRTGPIAGEFGGASVTAGSIGGRKNVNNARGMTCVNTRDQYTDSTGGTRYIYAKLANLPEYDPEDPTVTVYFRFINTNEYSYKLSFGLGKSTDVNNDASRVSYELDVEPNSTKIFGITLDRNSADEDIYFSIQILNSNSNTEYNFCVQMMYNNRIGAKPEDIAVKQSND